MTYYVRVYVVLFTFSVAQRTVELEICSSSTPLADFLLLEERRVFALSTHFDLTKPVRLPILVLRGLGLVLCVPKSPAASFPLCQKSAYWHFGVLGRELNGSGSGCGRKNFPAVHLPLYAV